MVAVELAGPIQDLWLGHTRSVPGRCAEVLIEGPAGTGKTWGIWYWLVALLTKAPAGARVLVVRKTLASIRQSMQPTVEDKVLPLFGEALRRHLLRGPQRDHRRSYHFPTGPEVVLWGLDDVGNLDSVEADIVWIEEARHVQRATYDRLKRCLRNNALPWQLMLLSTNPGSDGHWLAPGPYSSFPDGRRRAPIEPERRVRLLSRHEDNPSVTESYLEYLRSMQGAQRAQLLEGRWCGESGRIWPTYDEAQHMHDMRLEQRGLNWGLVAPGSRDFAVQFKGFAASFDPGYRAPACFGVWGISKEGPAYLVAECYATGLDQEEWARTIEGLYESMPFRAGVVDSAAADLIDLLNDHLGRRFGRKTGRVMFSAHKEQGSVEAGLDVVRWALGEGLLNFLRPEQRMRPVHRRNQETGEWGVFPWPDPAIYDAGKPTSSTAEIHGYIFIEAEMGTTDDARAKRERKEEPDPKCADHGCFVAGTRVATLNRAKPVEAMCGGDLVWTPAGPRPVVWAGQTGSDVSVGTVELSGGERITGTPDHHVWTSRGWVRLDMLSYGDTVAACLEASSTAARSGTSTGAGTTGGDPERGGTTSASSAEFTRTRSVQSLPAGTSTTATATRQTTTPATSKRSPRLSTCAGAIQGTSKSRRRPQGSGMHPLTAVGGIARMPSEQASVFAASLSDRASDAASHSRPARIAPLSARLPVGQPSAGQVASMTKYADAPSVRASSWQTDTRRPELVLRRVVRPFVGAGRADVYNIEVEGEHVFFAEGVLVANCDMIRYFARHFFGDHRPFVSLPEEPVTPPLFGTVEFFDTTFPGEKKLYTVAPRR